MTYEGARSITGPYLAYLGASAAVVGAVSGAGELLGYGLRLAAGYLTDRTRRYWTAMLGGYAVNLLSVPLLAFARGWPAAAGLIVLERTGRAIRKPAGDAMLAHAGATIGRGWAFGLREALDQTGAMLGPIGIAILLVRHTSYPTVFAALAIPAVLALAVLVGAQRQYPHPEGLVVARPPALQTAGLPGYFWVYVGAGALIAAGTVDFPLVAYHFARRAVVPEPQIPLLYAVAMATSGLAALVTGRMYDKRGLGVIAAATSVAALATPLLFIGGIAGAWLGACLWGIGLGVQEGTVRAALGDRLPPDRLASAYGIFDTAFGVAWFAGSVLMGFLYGRSPVALVVFSIATQLIAVAGLGVAVASPALRPRR